MGLKEGTCDDCGGQLLPLVEPAWVYRATHDQRDGKNEPCSGSIISTSSPDANGGRTMKICPKCATRDARYELEEERDIVTGYACRACGRSTS